MIGAANIPTLRFAKKIRGWEGWLAPALTDVRTIGYRAISNSESGGKPPFLTSNLLRSAHHYNAAILRLTTRSE